MTSAGRTPTTPRSAPAGHAGGLDSAGAGDPVTAISQRSADDVAGVTALSGAGTDRGGLGHAEPTVGPRSERGSAAGGPPASEASTASALGEQAHPDDAVDAAGPAGPGGSDESGSARSDAEPGSDSDSDGSDSSERSGSTSPDRVRARLLFARLVSLPEGDPERAALRDQLVRMHLPLVEYLARRFRNRGEPLDDLVQVATIGLIKSVDRFDPERGVEFSTYATPTIVGEIKRHFRDKGWAIRVPRRLQELKLSLTKATSELSQSLGRSPTVSEIARHLEMTEEEVLEGLESANAYSAVSLDAPDSGDDEAPAVADTLGVQDESLEGVEYRESLKPLLEKLPPREKRILLLRFFGNMTQSQIANELGISQMHVSRLLARTLAQLRRGLLEDG
ncbi:RNA polymerase sigma factor SigF [Parafrankia sp. EUN1f]|uniref:RNA polymerase sigma factor SigF n=1 Tax=Parafrankia sp. EUN1f TaxID=102897 RepID=UPI0001C4559A|nr:RNA polymerase sigma factor SigF [Parafrankia sp. EUN1f]EFC84896.1 RNA polymerase, sigma 28 subunit, Sig B/F/G subfamily [Parafrankia sp. EUN1f]